MQNTTPHISVVSPVYRGEKMVAELVRRIKENVATITEDFEIILVNDASPDASWAEIQKACAADARVKGIDLSRNFGQQAAITAGLHYAKGEWVVVMDCDLQDRPEEIPNLYRKTQEGWDIVYARRVQKQFGFWKKATSAMFNKLFKWLSGIKKDSSIGNFGIYRSNVIDAYLEMPEVSRSFITLIFYLGFKNTTLDVRHAERLEGTSSYSLSKLFKLAFDVMIANSNFPLRLAVGMGFVMAFFSFLLALYNIIAKLVGIVEVAGFTTTVFSIWFVGGVILLMLGVLGLYIGKVFEQVKSRPIFVVRETRNVENGKTI